MSVNAATSPSGLLALSIALPSLCICTAALRINLRRRKKTPYRVNDLMIVPALMFFIGMCICAILGVNRQVWGYPTPFSEADTNPDAFTSDTMFESQLLEAFQFVQIITLGITKLAALLFYHRIFCSQANNSFYDITIRSFVAVVVLWTIAMLIMNGVQCGSHILALWATDPNMYLQYCLYVFPFEVSFAISNFLLDFMILVLPMPKIWSLHMPTTRKVALSGVFGLALVGFAGSIARMVIYLRIDANGPSLTADYRHTESVFWSIIEAGLSFQAVNLPSL